MQKNKILALELPNTGQKPDGWSLTGRVKKLGKKMHFIGDLYYEEEYVARLAINKDEYAVYDREEDIWRRGWADSMDIGGRTVCWNNILCDTDTSRQIMSFTHSKGNCGKALRDKMNGIYYRNNAEEKRKLEQKRDLELTPDIPEGFEEWTKTLFKDEDNLMFYKRDSRKRATVNCGICGNEKEYMTSDWGEPGTIPGTIYTPKSGEPHWCSRCRKKGTFTQAGRIKRQIKRRMAYLFQNTPDGGIVIRMFEITREQERGYPEFYQQEEIMRAYLNRFKEKKYYRHITYKGERWSRYNPGRWNGAVKFKYGEVYHGWKNAVRNSLYFQYCDVEFYAGILDRKRIDVIDAIDILTAYANMPQIEMLAKMGMYRLARTAIRYGGIWGVLNKKAKDAAGFLKIEKSRMKGIGDIGVEMLQIFQFEKKQNIHLDEEEIETILDAGNYDWETRLLGIMRFMSHKKALNRIREYAETEFEENTGSALREFSDYLNIRRELGYDMTNSVFLHPKNLRETHKDMVEERERRRSERFIKKKMEEYPKIAAQYESLCRKYQYTDGEYIIRPAKSAEEIIMEGRLLHHCVGGDGYLSKHNRGYTSILMLRKKEEPDTPYITIEIRGIDIIQWYGINDTKPDKEKIQQVIRTYTERLEKKQKEKKENRVIAKQTEHTLRMAAG